ncbi:MAG TPA: response regulator [Polyangiaceae bacterium]|nr:response regulator [Polyangiaceae bacterium]
MTSVLLVDDDESNRLTMSALLEVEGFDVREATTFAEACTLLSATPSFTIVLTDQHLGDGLGSDLAPMIRARLPGAKIVLMSGSASAMTVTETWDGSFAKGEDFAELLRLIHSLLIS